MDGIILLTGKVKFPLTIDPGVWIFDDRKISLDDAMQAQEEHGEDLDSYAKRMSEILERELIQENQGTAKPPVNKSTEKFKKEKLLTGNFGMPLAPFLKNAEPEDISTSLIIETEGGERFELPLEEAQKAVLGFSKEGKPLKEDGPVHFYYGDGSNKDNPIKHVTKFIVN
ncbi:peptidyl-prolyl cis-trans isomerase [Bacillus tianshenii]|nr:peptidyl-prolyl cis-trans isomerase [Bacillus tianshenii]